MSISHRAIPGDAAKEMLSLWSILSNLHHPTTNPSGFVSLGVAENSLMHTTLSQHIHANMALPDIGFTYGDQGIQVRTALARFLTKHLKPVRALEVGQITQTNGCSAAIEFLAWALADEGDVVLLGQPYYGAFPNDVSYRFKTNLTLVPFDGVDPMSGDIIRFYEKHILKARREKKRVAAILIAHPHNPLGRCYSVETLTALMKLCQKYKCHLISDEIYALSTFENTVDAASKVPIVPFQSILTIDPTNIIDPALVHVIWGISKDFGANGLRFGAIISQANPALHQAISPAWLFSSTSSLTEHVVTNMLSDEAWSDEYIRENQRRLGQQYEHVTRWARENQLTYAPGVNAGFFLWVDLGKAYLGNHPGFDGDLDAVLGEALQRERVFLATGTFCGAEKPGWFRIVFSQETEYLDEGLKRIIAAVQ